MQEYDKLPQFQQTLEELIREGARKMLQQAIENELEEVLTSLNQREGLHVKRNGYLPQRKIQTGIGNLPIKKPRLRGVSFDSSVLPKYMRRVPSLEALIPTLYLKGISTGNMQEALEALLGPGAKGLSPTNIARLTQSWAKDYESWQARDLSDKKYVYFWVDGIYFNVRLGADRPCLLVIIGALANGQKEMVAIDDGMRESKLSWQTLLRDLKKRGLKTGPKLCIGDGGLGFWNALEEEFPACKPQRCWVHKTANILDKMPKSVQVSAKKQIHEMYMSPSREKGLAALDEFISLYEGKYPKACECLLKDREALFNFYSYPAEHWQHIRTTNPIESTFATVRHRSRQTKGCGSWAATLSLVYKLCESAEKHWRKLRGYQQIEKVLNGTIFKDGEEVKKVA